MAVRRISITFLLALWVVSTPLSSQDCSSPPTGFGNAWWSGYADWCSACGGTPDSSTTSCTPGTNWGNSSSANLSSGPEFYTGDPATDLSIYMMQQTLPVFFDAIGQQIACEFDPNCPRKVYERQMEQQRQKEREANLRAEEEARQRREKERQALFEQSKQDLLGELRLQAGSRSLQARNLSLETREVSSALGVRTLAPRDLSLTSTTMITSIRSPLARASCGLFLLRRSDEAAIRGDFQEAAFLSNEAAALLGGEKISSAVQCPPLPDVPDAGPGREVLTEAYREKSNEIDEALKKRSQFARSMYQRVLDQGTRYREKNEAVEQAEEEKQQAKNRLEEARKVLALSQQQPALPLGVEASSTIGDAQSGVPPDKKAESAMAEAMAALEAAEDAFEDADEELQKELKQKAELEEQMHSTRSLFDQVKKDPENLDKVLESLGSPAQARIKRAAP